MLSRRALIVLGTTALCVPPTLSMASATEDVVLEVTGLIDPREGRPEVRFTMNDLAMLGTTSFATRSPWYPDSCRFEGVLVSRVMQAVGARGTTARVSALNDYAADIPVSDFAAYKPILAMRRNGEPMPVSDKGPLFLIYPFDDIPELQHQSFYSRSVWQLNRIEVV